MLTLGSLFDGIGGWLLAAVHNGVKPIWSSEIEKFPMAVTKHHFPDVIQLGDITKLDGATLPPVDIICAGSPCQDLSVAGKREGLKGERSGLFINAINIVRRMRWATNGKFPRFFVWENVPGAFSSNKGLDFRAVLEEIGQTEVPMPANDKWAENGVAQLPGCEIAWRVLDAVAWVPQRRKRIFLVADFGPGKPCAKEILFVEPSVCGNFEKGESERKEVAGSVTDGPGTPIVLRMRGGCDGGGKGALLSENRSLTLAANTNDQVVFSFDSLSSNSMKSSNPNSGCRQVEVAKTLDTTTQDPSKNQGGVAVVFPLEGNGVRESHRGPGYSESEKMFTLNTVERHAVAYCIQGNMVDRETKQRGSGIYTDRSCTLTAVDRHAVAYDAYQHHNWREAEVLGPLTTHGNGVRGDTPLVADMSITGVQSETIYDITQRRDVVRTYHGVCPTLNSMMGTGGNNVPVRMESIPDEVMSTTGGQNAYAIGNGQTAQLRMQDKVGTLNCMHDQIAIMQKLAVENKQLEVSAPMTDEDSTDKM